MLLEFNMLNTLENLIKLARERKKTPVEGSYTNKLLNDKRWLDESGNNALNLAKKYFDKSNLIHSLEEVLVKASAKKGKDVYKYGLKLQ